MNSNQHLHTCLGSFDLVETVPYPNGGRSFFYTLKDTAIIIDQDICNPPSDHRLFAYRSITNKQNEYMAKYRHVYRFLTEDVKLIDETLQEQDVDAEYQISTADRSNLADASPLEMEFENQFLDVYGSDSAKYLWKEYGLTDPKGRTRYFDYFIRSTDGDIAIEENGVHFHHPQEIGLRRYRDQLAKQNLCTNRDVKLFRFSSEDVEFEDRIKDDIRSFFGNDSSHFVDRGLLADRPVVLYDHQEATLSKMAAQRAEGIRSFLIVFPTASGKSKIVEEDILAFAAGRKVPPKVAILVPNDIIKRDWISRVDHSLSHLKEHVLITTYAYMERHFSDYRQDHFQYLVVDEAHHAVAPGLKRTIQYFQPEFLVGITATDERPDKKRLETIFGSYQVGLSLKEAMEQGIIATANVYRIETNIDLSEVRINGKDYVNADLEKSVRVTSRNDLIVNVLREYFCEGDAGKRQGIVFCVNVNHTQEMERLLNASGISARAYHSGTKQRDKVMQDFKEHKIRFLCSCQMISEGWDYPELGILVMARPTLSKVLYLQQLGRGLRKTAAKKNVFVIDVVDEYGSMVQPCSLHSIFQNPHYVPFGDITRQDYKVGEFITIDGLQERVERIVEIDTDSFDEKYSDYLSEEQLARDFFLNTGTVRTWIKKGKIQPSVSFPFGSKKIYLFSPEARDQIRLDMKIPKHTDETIKKDFFDFIEERDYALSYKMVFMLSFLKHMDPTGDAKIDDVLDDYTSFYQDRIDRGLPVDRKTCPFTTEKLANKTFVKNNMLTNPFEKFERKRFLYYSKDLSIISMNHALHARLGEGDFEKIREQMQVDLKDYYGKLEG